MKHPVLPNTLLAASLFAHQVPKDSEVSANEASFPFQSPDELYGQLFVDVQMNRVFPDGKTFVDCVPRSEPAEILEHYQRERLRDGFDLKAFVLEHFDLPPEPGADFRSDPSKSITEHINSLWPVLTRQPDAETAGSLIPLPNPYIVPGGRFREIYYWDSYFTMLGLQVAGRDDMIASMVDNFAYMVEKVGYIPNGNRTYFLGRSQPPFFSLMVGVLAGMRGEGVYQQYLPQLEKEYDFWMAGADDLRTRQRQSTALTHRRVVLLPDGKVLNRYWDDRDTPRPESYLEDVETANNSGRPPKEMYRDLRAGAESGWDFSSRWFADGKTLETIHATEILPVDLNALLYHLEWTLAQTCEANGNHEKGAFYNGKAKNRLDAVQQYLWNPESGIFLDYDFVKQEPTYIPSLAGIFPLFFKMATPDQATKIASVIKKDFLRDGGLVSTLSHTGQQWDAPNGWAPLQWIATKGLWDYSHKELANSIRDRWVKLNTDVYARTGKMVEKYNVQDMSLKAGGGEYPVQDGFGWSNGVLLRLAEEAF